MKMAIEIVSFPIKNGDFPLNKPTTMAIVILIYFNSG